MASSKKIPSALCAAVCLVTMTAAAATEPPISPVPLPALCTRHMGLMPGPFDHALLAEACEKVQKLARCESVGGEAIYHYERAGTAPRPKRIFAKALIHGDEKLAGTAARAWLARLERLAPRNTWRIVPVANPDGWHQNTRTNRNGVDLNRNFPTKDWPERAQAYWKARAKSDPRRNPGLTAASEPETRCLIDQIEDFRPDLIISVHTPLGTLDLDGPKIDPPRAEFAKNALKWFHLGHFPGSLGRYMWLDRNVPVLTIELTGNEDAARFEAFDRLQDLSGSLAIALDKDKAKNSRVR